MASPNPDPTGILEKRNHAISALRFRTVSERSEPKK